MAHIFNVKLSTQATRDVKVLAESAEEAQGKVTPNEGETVVEVTDEGEVIS